MSIAYLFLLLCGFVAATWDNNDHAVGLGTQSNVYGKYHGCSSTSVKSIIVAFAWRDVEGAGDDIWDFSRPQKRIEEWINDHPDVGIILKPQTGYTAPTWLYEEYHNSTYNYPPNSHGYVPMVMITNTSASGHDQPWPYYLDPNYQYYFERFVRKTYDWIINNKYFPHNLIANWGCFGSTGDGTPWHGDPVNSSYDISGHDWWAFEQQQSLYMYDVYYNANPSTVPYMLLLWNMGNLDWFTNNTPGCYYRSAENAQGYQLNLEYDDYLTYGAASQMVQNGIKIRLTGENEAGAGNTKGQWYYEAPYWNYFTTMQWYLVFGIDMPQITTYNTLENPDFSFSWDFFSLFVQWANASEAKGAFIALRDGLDSYDTDRFPEDEYGENRIHNCDRFQKIADSFAKYGAAQGDNDHACASAYSNEHSKAMNDVGYKIFATNYANYIEQIDPQGTSQGYWRVGPMMDPSQPYGRFARGFHYKTNKTKMCFQLDRDLWGGLPLAGPTKLLWNVTYWDDGYGHWSFEYDAVDNPTRTKISVARRDSQRWIVQNFEITDAYFGRRCDMGGDFCLYTPDNHDVVLSYIQVLQET